MSSVVRALADLPGKPVLLNDVEPAAVFSAPKARVVVRWIVVVALVVLLFGLLGWSYATSSELASNIQVKRHYKPAMEDIRRWEAQHNTFTCPCSNCSTVDWAVVVPQLIWQQFFDMQMPNGPVGTPEYNSFCVSRVQVGGNSPYCTDVQHDVLNTPGSDRTSLLARYPGSALQAPACRAIAANLMRLNGTKLQATTLLSEMDLNTTVQNALNETMYRTAAQVQSTMMTLWSLEVALDTVNANWNGFYSGSLMDCSASNTCASEDCLLRWFSYYISRIQPNYAAFYDACKPNFCDVVIQKSAVTKVVNFLSTLGGLWNPLYLGALLLWLMLAGLPCLAVTGRQQMLDAESLKIGK